MQNVITKWMDPDWVQAATSQAAADDSGGVAGVHCSWNQVATATGRLSSSSPNLQVRTGSKRMQMLQCTVAAESRTTISLRCTYSPG